MRYIPQRIYASVIIVLNTVKRDTLVQHSCEISTFSHPGQKVGQGIGFPPHTFKVKLIYFVLIASGRAVNFGFVRATYRKSMIHSY